MKNGKPDGYWKTYYMTGVLKSEGNRKNHILDSIWIFYNNIGDTVKKINYVMGKKTGYLYTYNTDRTSNYEYIGNIISKELYINDKKQGASYYYYKSGKLKSTVEYKDNGKDGLAWEYDEKGKITSILRYRKGTLVEREKINRIDGNGFRQGTWKEFYNDILIKEINYRDNKLDGLYKEYDRNGNLTLILRYKEGKLVEENNIEDEEIDLKNEYDENNNVIYSGAYRKEIPIGIHRKYDINGIVINSYIYNDMGNKISEGIVDKEGRKVGDWKNFYNTGEVKSTGNYENNLKTGKWNYFFKNGNIEQTGEYLNGKPNGLWIWYYPDGTIEREEEFYNGKEEGLFVEYDEAGEVIAKGEYFDGEKEGEWYYKVGDHCEKGSYVIGLKDGKWKYFYDSGELNYEGNYIQGNPDGKHKYYYSNNVLKEEQFYVMGIREKHWKKFDEYGNLLITISYKNDREVRINGVKVELKESDIKLIK
jgi:antitoxin component YwqK of YwqJK toxin-antitoxin module